VRQPDEQRSWIARHPALFGAIVGAGVGAGVGYGLGGECTGQEFEPCSSKGEAAVVGAGLFAGIAPSSDGSWAARKSKDRAMPTPGYRW